MRIDRVVKVIRIIMEEGEVPMLVGEAGIGKTEVVKRLAEETSRELKIVVLSQMEPGDLLGLPFIHNGATHYSPPDWLPKTGKSIVFFDEINRAHRLLRAAVMELLIDKRIHNHVLPEGTWIIGAVNPSTENYEVYEMIDRAFIDRFVWIPVTNSIEAWNEYMKRNFFDKKVHEISDKILRSSDLYEYIEHFYDTPEIPEIKVTPRSLTRYVKLYRAFEERGMLEEFFEISKGIVGRAASILDSVVTSNFEYDFTYRDLLSGDIDRAKKVDSIQRTMALRRLLSEIEKEIEKDTFDFENYERAFEVVYKVYSLEETSVILRWINEMKHTKKPLYDIFNEKKKEYYLSLYRRENHSKVVIKSLLKQTIEKNSWFFKVLKRSLTGRNEELEDIPVNKELLDIAI